MSDEVISYGTPIGIFNEGGDVRLDLGLDVTSALVRASEDRPSTRFVIRRLDAEDADGEVRAEHVVGIFTEDKRFRLDIGHACFAYKVSAEKVSETTVLCIEHLGDKRGGPVHYGELVGIFTSDHQYRLDIGTPPLKSQQGAGYESWATRLRVQAVPPLRPPAPDPSGPAKPPVPPVPPQPPRPDPHDGGTGKPEQHLTTLERIFVGVYEGVKRAQVDVQRGAQRKFDWFFPLNDAQQREARTVEVPIPLADGSTEVRKIPLFALVPHHDLMIDTVTVKMKVDLLQLTQSSLHPDINEIESAMARSGDKPEMLAEIEIHLKGTEPAEGVARLNDEIIKRF